MILFNCDYSEGAHADILRRLAETNMEQTAGYGAVSYTHLVFTLADLEKMTSVEAFKKICGNYPDKTVPVCYYLYSLAGALLNLHWNDLSLIHICPGPRGRRCPSGRSPRSLPKEGSRSGPGRRAGPGPSWRTCNSGAVSYTHLDVYKRQSPYREAMERMSMLAGGRLFILLPVSYTHLFPRPSGPCRTFCRPRRSGGYGAG